MAAVTSARGRRPTLEDVAREAGVSRATVGYVLNRTAGQTISAATTERVHAVAARLKYRPHAAARSLAAGRSGVILVVLPGWPVTFSLGTTLDALARALGAEGYAVITQGIERGSRVRPFWEQLPPDVVVGFGRFSAAELTSMEVAGVTRVITPEHLARTSDADGAAPGTKLQVEHLYELGHRKLAFATVPTWQRGMFVAARRRVAKKVATSLGATLVADAAVVADGSAVDVVRAWHEDGITGVVAFNDDAAAIVAGAALRAGLRVPEDLAVVGHDDSPLASLFVPSLSSAHVDPTIAGRWLADQLLHEIDGRPISPMPELAPTLTVRESTAGRPKARGRRR